MRTEALVKSLEVNAVDDATLIGLLILALNARNVSIQTHGSGHATRTKLVQSITEGGRLSHDVERLRVAARQTLANVLSCSLGHGDSDLPARIAGDAIGADAHLGNMATEEFVRQSSASSFAAMLVDPTRSQNMTAIGRRSAVARDDPGVGLGGLAAVSVVPRAAIALRRRLRCPNGTPS